MDAGTGRVAEFGAIPQDKRRGRLKNGNPPGDFSAPRCGAKTRGGTHCQCPAMRNGRCRLHGGLSTGPKTAAGIEAIRRARTKHGYYSKEAIIERRQGRVELRVLRQTLAYLSELSDSPTPLARLPSNGQSPSDAVALEPCPVLCPHSIKYCIN
jgi:hypothetical protein